MAAPTTLPASVVAAHEGWTHEPHWAPYWTTVWKLSSPDGHTRFAKVAWKDRYPTLAQERDRMDWSRSYLPVPVVVDYGCDTTVEWLVTDALPGIDATNLTADPDSVVRIFGKGLRALHEALPVEGCPFDFRLDVALSHCRRRVESGREMQDDLHDEFKHFTPRTAIEWLETHRPHSEDLVVCHGDYCFPNVMIDGGRAVGYLDLGELGVADRWWDLAIGTWTCDWNVGPGYQGLFLESYGVQPDEHRIEYYRLMYDLAS